MKLQEIYNRITETKKEIREIKSMYSDALKNSQEYQRINDEIKALKDRKKKIEDSIKDDFSSEFHKLDTLKVGLENDKMLLSDAALTMITKGESIEIVDDKEQKYEPVFSVKFKKR